MRYLSNLQDTTPILNMIKSALEDEHLRRSAFLSIVILSKSKAHNAVNSYFSCFANNEQIVTKLLPQFATKLKEYMSYPVYTVQSQIIRIKMIIAIIDKFREASVLKITSNALEILFTIADDLSTPMPVRFMNPSFIV